MALIAGGATAAINAGGLWATPLTIGAATIDISSSKATKVKTS